MIIDGNINPNGQCDRPRVIFGRHHADRTQITTTPTPLLTKNRTTLTMVSRISSASALWLLKVRGQTSARGRLLQTSNGLEPHSLLSSLPGSVMSRTPRTVDETLPCPRHRDFLSLSHMSCGIHCSASSRIQVPFHRPPECYSFGTTTRTRFRDRHPKVSTMWIHQKTLASSGARMLGLSIPTKPQRSRTLPPTPSTALLVLIVATIRLL